MRPLHRRLKAQGPWPGGRLGLPRRRARDAGVRRVGRLELHVGADVVDGLGDGDGGLGEAGGDELELAGEGGDVAAGPDAVEAGAHEAVDDDRALLELEAPVLERAEL